MANILVLNARDNVYLQVLSEYCNSKNDDIHQHINELFNQMVDVLKSKKINYLDLKPAIVPSSTGKEAVFIFDRNKIASGFYGIDVMKKILPLFNKGSTHSVFVGDYIGEAHLQDFLKKQFFENIITGRKNIQYEFSNQFFLVYINNLNKNMIQEFNLKLLGFKPYVGYFDLTYSSILKSYISNIIGQIFIKHKDILISQHPDDVDNIENYKMYLYPFDDGDKVCKSIQSIYYLLFLSYKIESRHSAFFKEDINFSLNTITNTFLSIHDFKLVINENKMKYLLENKSFILQEAGLIGLSIKQLEKLLKDKLKYTYLYNLRFLMSDHNDYLFTMMFENKNKTTQKNIKFTVGFKYEPHNKILHVTTLF